MPSQPRHGPGHICIASCSCLQLCLLFV
uniref:Uncharacterized protein n=1 Tax=Arundo donax TaxID=35708 RepID=A0A0A8YJ19_ARUDO